MIPSWRFVRRSTSLACLVAIAAYASPFVHAQGARRRAPLRDAEIDTIAQLLKLEDTRQFDDAALGRAMASPHPEVRRRAVVTAGRIVDPRGRALLAAARAETDPEILATIAFSTGQLKDAAAIPWLAGLLAAPTTPPAAAFEAARALGKIRAPEARAALRHIPHRRAGHRRRRTASSAKRCCRSAASRPARHRADREMDDVAERRGALARGVGALPAARSGGACRTCSVSPTIDRPRSASGPCAGSPPGPVDAAGLDRAVASARIREAVNDPDRRVRTEALRVLAQYDDDASFAVVLAALDSPDTWLSVSAAESARPVRDSQGRRGAEARGGGRRRRARWRCGSRRLHRSPRSRRRRRRTLAHSAGRRHEHRRQGAGDADTRAPRRTAARRRRDAPRPPRHATRRAHGCRGLPRHRQALDRRRLRGRGQAACHPRDAARRDRDRAARRDAPLGLELPGPRGRLGTRSSAPSSAASCRTSSRSSGRSGTTWPLRDEVNRRGLLRGTLSWASAGLDTGRPGYTLGNTPQPHNEGDFTSLGRVVRGMDAVDRLELGDKVTGARIRR